jgi:AhpD family alkylhydroperoxidase
MKTRLSIKTVQPKAYQAMGALEKYVNESSIDLLHRELLKIRASQINGCAYCVDMHTRDARKLGLSEQKAYLISTWREAGAVFTEEEKLLFQMTEEITLIHQHGISETVYEQALQTFGETQTAQILMAIITINAWNRIGVGLKMEPEIEQYV